MWIIIVKGPIPRTSLSCNPPRRLWKPFLNYITKVFTAFLTIEGDPPLDILFVL